LWGAVVNRRDRFDCRLLLLVAAARSWRATIGGGGCSRFFILFLLFARHHVLSEYVFMLLHCAKSEILRACLRTNALAARGRTSLLSKALAAAARA